jgi:hypothetical protein
MYRVIEASFGEESPAGCGSAEPYIQTLSHRMIKVRSGLPFGVDIGRFCLLLPLSDRQRIN